MRHIKNRLAAAVRTEQTTANRRGAFMVLAFLGLLGVIGFMALSADISRISLTKTQMQSAVDAAALAAAQEIIAAVEVVGEEVDGGGGDVAGDVADANSIAVEAAKTMAVQVADLNGVYVDPERDVEFGKRVLDPTQPSGYGIEWNEQPYNVVRVIARRDNPDSSQPDARLPLFFAPIFGHGSSCLRVSATAYVEARDIVVVMDYSASMNDDSEFRSINKLTQSSIEDNMQDIYNALGPPDMGSMTFEPQWLKQSASVSGGTVTVTFMNTSARVECTNTIKKIKLKFTNGSYQTFSVSGTDYTKSGTGSNYGRTISEVWVKSPYSSSSYKKLYDTTSNVKSYFGLNSVNWPWPSGSWDSFIDHCRSDSDINNAGYRRKYGGACLVDYLLDNKSLYANCPDLWKTPHYPFHAAKNGASLFCEFLQGLDFGDHLGLVTYATYSKVQTGLNDEYTEETVDLGDDLLTSNYAAINTIQRHKQAGHFASTTGIGYGIEDAWQLLESHGRYGARPTILLMTDGLANQSPNGWSLPGSWDWDELTDYDGDGQADYTTNDRHKQYAFWQVKQAIDHGCTFHTLSVGVGADRDLMKAIAFAGGGEWIDVPGGSTVAAMEEQMLAAFGRIAANVPPAKLAFTADEE